MNQSSKHAIYKALLENRWLDIEYKNSKGEITNFYYGIQSIDLKHGKLYGEIFNLFKDINCVKDPKPISLEGVLSADCIDETYFETPNEILERIDDPSDPLHIYLEVDSLDNDILDYLGECFKLDTDPFLKYPALVDGIIPEEFKKSDTYQLDEKQFKEICDKVFKKDYYNKTKIFDTKQTIGFNLCSINLENKEFVIAYRAATINLLKKTLKLAKNISINKTFLIDKHKISLSQYIDMFPEEFVSSFAENHREYIEMIKDNLHQGEKIDTSPYLFLQARQNTFEMNKTISSIKELEKQEKLPYPLKAFFGRNRLALGKKDPLVVIRDARKINIDQMRVVYNAMANHVTYVKGPPGTGKTETIFNVILSALANNKTVLICSNNNHPVDDIWKKLNESFYRKKFGSEEMEKIKLPAIRVGNNEETKNTLLELKETLAIARKNEKRNLDSQKTEKSKLSALSRNDKLRTALVCYEDAVNRKEDIRRLKQISKLTSTPEISKQIAEQIGLKEKGVEEIMAYDDESIARLAVSASEDFDFQNFLYYSYLAHIKKLLSPSYQSLIAIIESQNEDEAVQALNEYLKDDENLRKFIAVFPIVLCTNLSCGKLGSPKPHFDLVIMDEAGQCNVASSLIPIVRGDGLLLVGDTDQLQPVILLDEESNESLKKKFGIKPEYDYIDNSILSTMRKKDANSKQILLRYHYRCANKIASFPNQRYYEEKLKLKNLNAGVLEYVNVKNDIKGTERNSYLDEANAIVKLVKENHYKDVGIITPFANQSALLNYLLEKEGIHDVKAGTVHTLQGSEKSTIILSSAISLRTANRTMEWLKDNHELINVAVTRAKERLIFVGDKEAIDKRCFGENCDLKALSDYVSSKGSLIVPKSSKIVIHDFSNDSVSEKEFFDTVSPYFNKRGSKFKIERNIRAQSVFKDLPESDKQLLGNKEFDVVVYVKKGLLKRAYDPIVIFEIDGGEHVALKSRKKSDQIKNDICRKAGIKLIRINNEDVKDYEIIIMLFQNAISGMEKVSEMKQGSLFDDFGYESQVQ